MYKIQRLFKDLAQGHKVRVWSMKTNEIECFIRIRCIKIFRVICARMFFFWYFTVWKQSKCANMLSVFSFPLSPTKLKSSSITSFFSQPMLFITSLWDYNLQNTPIPWARTNKVRLVLLDELFDRNKMLSNKSWGSIHENNKLKIESLLIFTFPISNLAFVRYVSICLAIIHQTKCHWNQCKFDRNLHNESWL